MGAASNSQSQTGVGGGKTSTGNPIGDIAQATTQGFGQATGKGASPSVQNVTPLRPVLSGNGLSQAQASGANEFTNSNPTLMSVQPPGQAQNTITSGQPIMGQPNQYMNTTGLGNQPFTYAQHNNGYGKGKG